MERCFIIQPFDRSDFDARYEDVIVPAVIESGLEPYRVDRDPGVRIPIEDIERGIRNARICLAEITLDNPNVWFELGYAIAAYKDVVLVCSDDRKTRFPFDVQHRAIITYGTGSPRNFDQLKSDIKDRINALIKKEQTIQAAAVASQLKTIHGLGQLEVVTLAAIGENISSVSDLAAGYRIRSDMEKAGFNNLATTIGLKTLLESKLVSQELIDEDNGDANVGYRLTDLGWEWILSNKSEFVLTRESHEVEPYGDDVPF